MLLSLLLFDIESSAYSSPSSEVLLLKNTVDMNRPIICSCLNFYVCFYVAYKVYYIRLLCVRDGLEVCQELEDVAKYTFVVEHVTCRCYCPTGFIKSTKNKIHFHFIY